MCVCDRGKYHPRGAQTHPLTRVERTTRAHAGGADPC
jgi:hypothetical protein